MSAHVPPKRMARIAERAAQYLEPGEEILEAGFFEAPPSTRTLGFGDAIIRAFARGGPTVVIAATERHFYVFRWSALLRRPVACIDRIPIRGTAVASRGLQLAIDGQVFGGDTPADAADLAVFAIRQGAIEGSVPPDRSGERDEPPPLPFRT